MDNSKQNLFNFIKLLRQELKIDDNSYPLDTVEICTSDPDTDVKYHQFSTHGFCAAVLLGNKRDTVILNKSRNKIEMNFDCGHEIIHMTKHRKEGINSFSCMDPSISYGKSASSFFEWEANEGSAELLVPYYLLLPEIKKIQPMLTEVFYYRKFKRDMAEKFHVTEAVIKFRFDSLKYEIQQYLDGTPLEDLQILSNNQLKKRGIKVKSLNDIEDDLFQSDYHISFAM